MTTNDTITPVQPPRRRRRPRKGIVITAALGALAGIALAVGATAHSPAAHPGPARTAHSPAATASAPAAQAIPDPDVELITWWYAGGQGDADTVESDLQGISTDAGQENLIAVESDGTGLVADARAALADPPPADAAFTPAYTAALRQLVIAGQDMTAGRIDAATIALAQGQADIDQATAALPGGTGS
jgi:hypothetical protein